MRKNSGMTLEKNGYSLAYLENFYQDLLRNIEIAYPEMMHKVNVVIRAKLITTRLSEEEKLMTKVNCLEIARKIKAAKETMAMLGICLTPEGVE